MPAESYARLRRMCLPGVSTWKVQDQPIQAYGEVVCRWREA